MKNVFVSLAILCQSGAISQSDSIIVTDLLSHTKTTIAAPPIDTSVRQACTPSYTGSLPGADMLPATMPTVNLFPNSQFSKPVPAVTMFNTGNFPARTAVKIIAYRADNSVNTCSGMMIAPDLVLTAGFCASVWGKTTTIDSIAVLPAFDEGVTHPALGRARGIKTMIWESQHYYPVAIVQLNSSVGWQCGWSGVGFLADTFSYQGKVAHMFSYPEGYAPDSSSIYSGDSIFYNYGQMKRSGHFIVMEGSGAAVFGQGGGATILENQVCGPAINGILYYSNLYLSQPITSRDYHNILSMISVFSTGLNEIAEPVTIHAYPNPFFYETRIPLAGDLQQASVWLYNNIGQQVDVAYTTVPGGIVVSRSGLPAGAYFLSIKLNGTLFRAKLLVTD